jgi:transcriptional regulator with XRE-family HTH domain
VALERRRFQGLRLLEGGLSQSEVARRLGVGHASVNRWAQALTQQGPEGLKKAGRAGRKPRLSAEDLKRLEQGLLRGAGGAGLRDALVDAVAGGAPDRAGVRGSLPPGPHLEDSAAAEVELPAAGGTGAGAEREGHPALEAGGVAGD